MKTILSPEDLRNICDTDLLTDALPEAPLANKLIIGQDRAIKALKLGIGMKAKRFNIYVSGAPGTGKLTAVKDFVEKQAATEPVPGDWCYVSNFRDAYCPDKLYLPAGRGQRFKKEMKGLVTNIYNALVKAFESEDFANRKAEIVNRFEDEQADILGRTSEHADQEGFMIKQTKSSIITIPLKDAKPITDAQLKNMPEAEIDAINEKQNRLQEELSAGLREIHKYEKIMNEDLDRLSHEAALVAVGTLVDGLGRQYSDCNGVGVYLQQLQEDIMDNLPEFMKAEHTNTHGDASSFLRRYEVTILVDNGGTSGAPVIIERNPTYNNLQGRVEKESFMGTLVTDFTMIRRGALHSANGGYLIIRVEELLKNYMAWDSLKRALKNNEVAIEDVADQMGYLTSRTLKPAPIPLDVKVILIGSAYYYQLLYEYDSDFRELFKVKADFDTVMPRTDEAISDYSAFVGQLCRNENLLTMHKSGIAAVIEYSSRLAGHQDKLSTRFGTMADIIREAAFYAMQDMASAIEGAHVSKAIEEKYYRSNLIQEKINEMVATRQILIDITDNVIGQINGLSVIDIGDISFGIPARITCSVSPGKEGVVAIEREAELSGPIHTKGVLILTGYLSSRFMQDKPISLSARLVFEQSYSEVEGDSASSTELYAILSALAYAPIKQGIAVTGSVNQKGEIQAVGGINEKIEGYFEVCKSIGLNNEQGVIIPVANVRNLMLKEEIVNAVANGNFCLWAIDTIEDGIEILTGIKAGSIWEEGTVFYNVNNTLGMFAERLRTFAGDEIVE